ncbi:MAG: alpha/beta hydrolase [Gammaproteobacteria bacterium]|nr:alpha/beta hydrolase [Gammaproteobacteria bacterium]
MLRVTRFVVWLFAGLLAACMSVDEVKTSPTISSLDELSINTLRGRRFGSSINIEAQPAHDDHDTFIASYQSDGLRVYSRIDVPDSPAPEGGFPVVLFVHGWAGIDAAPASNFYLDDDSNYQAMITSYVEAGFVVFTPGWRGHGTVNGIAADGIEFMQAWDNGSYLSPVFYAIDVLNLLDSLSTFNNARLDLENVNLVAHSQGGDVALLALAIAGEGSGVATGISSASIWSGCFPSRFTQLETYAPMQKSPEAFLASDGTWTGTPTGASGATNPNFVFGYPADWIGTPHVEEWTWQRESFSMPTVADVLEMKLGEMYGAINQYVEGIDDAKYEVIRSPGKKVEIVHDDRVRAAMSKIDAFYMEEYLTERLTLQHSDRDFYSLSAWNAELCARVNQAGGTCHDFEYVGNTHSLRVSENRWFSGDEAVPGFDMAIRRDIAFFNGDDPVRTGTSIDLPAE